MSFPSARLMRADAQRNHDAVLAAAKAVFAQAGIDAPMEDVARAAGVGKGTLYRRFPTREHLFASILQDRVNELDASAQRALDAPDLWRVRDRIPGHERPGRGVPERRHLGRRHLVRPDEKQLRPAVRAGPAGGPAPPGPDPDTAVVDGQRPAQG